MVLKLWKISYVNNGVSSFAEMSCEVQPSRKEAQNFLIKHLYPNEVIWDTTRDDPDKAGTQLRGMGAELLSIDEIQEQ